MRSTRERPSVHVRPPLCLLTCRHVFFDPACLEPAALLLRTPSSPAPKEIELQFSAHVSFPVIVLHDATGRRFESGTPRVDDSTVVEAVAGPLPPGSHTIAWRVVWPGGR
ncbi:copper resistance protein CopC [Microbispora bryophytorum]|uniref:copper resistance CopC family protein n=1 Tax=Microbispora bryophytorum TaxID=1460882 RepID=UPI0034047141